MAKKKVFMASVTDIVTKELHVIKSDEYSSKAKFAEDLRGGFKVRFIATEETFDEACEQYYKKLEDAKLLRKYVAEARNR
jgi:hypothetical protein